ncbi:MAG: hypothetical protein AAGJ82_04275 [Bacteroidota bacterium]
MSGSAEPIAINRIDCAGNIVEDDIFADEILNGTLETFTNFVLVDGIVYMNEYFTGQIAAYDLCNDNRIGEVDVQGYNNGRLWGLSLGIDGNIYVAGFQSGTGNTNAIFRFTPDPTLFSDPASTTLAPLFTLPGSGAVNGVTVDAVGHIYVVFSGGNATNNRVDKFDATGTLIASVNDAANNGQGFWDARGIAYSEFSDQLYVASQREDCVAVIDATTMTYNNAAAIPHVPGGEAKGLSIGRECCPTSNRQLFDITLDQCDIEAAGDEVFLSELIDCEGIICGGFWMPSNAASADIYNPCDQSILITDDLTPGVYSFDKIYDGLGNNPQCGAYEFSMQITVNACSFDLALRKQLSSSQTVFRPGDLVSYDLTIFNQGVVDAFDIDVADYFDNDELTFSSFSSTPATGFSSGAPNAWDFTIDELAAGQQLTVTITFMINVNFVGNQIINNAEIVDAAATPGGPTALDEDSDLSNTNDGSSSEISSDDDVNDDSNGSVDNAGDQDDYDPAVIQICLAGCGSFPWDGN